MKFRGQIKARDLNGQDMYYSELADKVRYFKEDEKWLNAMCKVIEDMRNETAENVTVFYIKKIMSKMKMTLGQAMDYVS